jgi:DNA-binding NarL/FixJ family response regulator
VEVVAEASDGQQALRQIEIHQPDVVLMDVSMPLMSGLTALARIHQVYPTTRVIMLSAYSDERYVRMAFAEGAVGYVLKQADKGDLVAAIQAVTRGLRYVGAGVQQATSAPLVTAEQPDGSPLGLEKLTVRQRQVLQLLAEGLNVRGIATRLRISPKTVETHRSQMMLRLKIDDLPGLVRFAIRMGLVSSER